MIWIVSANLDSVKEKQTDKQTKNKTCNNPFFFFCNLDFLQREKYQKKGTLQETEEALEKAAVCQEREIAARTERQLTDRAGRFKECKSTLSAFLFLAEMQHKEFYVKTKNNLDIISSKRVNYERFRRTG